MTAPVTTAMVLAAGLGTRMRPLTDRLPKPLIEVGGRTLIDRALDRLVAAGVVTAVVNTHAMAARLESHLAGRESPEIVISHEPELLETSGGVKRALPYLGADPFYVVNGDVIWTDGPHDMPGRLAAAWDDRAMDALMLLQPTVGVVDYDSAGDYFLGSGGNARRRRENEAAPYLFAGVQILHPRLFDRSPDGKFSLNLLYDRAQAAGRLSAIVHDGDWFLVGTVDGLRLATEALTRRHIAVDRRGR